MKKCYVLNYICDTIKKYKYLWVPFLWVAILSIFLTSIFLITLPHSATIGTLISINDASEKIYYSALVVLTFLLVCVAWIQLGKLHKISQEDFLLRVITHFNDKSIVTALNIIHELRLIAENENKNGTLKIENIPKFIAEKIRDLRDDNVQIRKFMYLKIFLDYLEHVAYLCNKEGISIRDIEKCMGGPIEMHYKYFENLIEFYRSANKNRAYSELKKLIKKFNC